MTVTVVFAIRKKIRSFIRPQGLNGISLKPGYFFSQVSVQQCLKNCKLDCDCYFIVLHSVRRFDSFNTLRPFFLLFAANRN